jgi:hypothetical protein
MLCFFARRKKIFTGQQSFTIGIANTDVGTATFNRQKKGMTSAIPNRGF